MQNYAFEILKVNLICTVPDLNKIQLMFCEFESQENNEQGLDPLEQIACEVCEKRNYVGNNQDIINIY